MSLDMRLVVGNGSWLSRIGVAYCLCHLLHHQRRLFIRVLVYHVADLFSFSHIICVFRLTSFISALVVVNFGPLLWSTIDTTFVSTIATT